MESEHKMRIQNAQEALYIACEMEKNAIQLYERAGMLLREKGRQDESLYEHVQCMLCDERKHLKQFSTLFTGLEGDTERNLSLMAQSSGLLFEGGLMAAAREGALKSVVSMLEYAANAEEKAARTYRGFAEASADSEARDTLLCIADEEDKHLLALEEMRLSYKA